MLEKPVNSTGIFDKYVEISRDQFEQLSQYPMFDELLVYVGF
jgi:hypothetical protein